ncbi:hypothetical protein MMC14_000259 [Varicellaria rhodocarpa]|nr:hypothetical protein [Varicellaria rhodocarpa]
MRRYAQPRKWNRESVILPFYFLHGVFYSAQKKIHEATGLGPVEKSVALGLGLDFNVAHTEQHLTTARHNDNCPHCHKLILLALELHPVIEQGQLFRAVENGLSDAMRIFIGHPSFKDLRLVDESGNKLELLWILTKFPLHWRAQEHEQTAKVLITEGGGVNEICGLRGTPLQTLMVECKYRRHPQEQRAIRDMAQLLLDNGADVNVDKGYGKPLAILQK